MSYEKLEKWFTSDLKILKTVNNSPCTQVQVYHMGSKRASLVAGIDVPTIDVEASGLAVKAYEAAQEDARGMERHGPQSYYVRLKFGSYMLPGRCTFRLIPESGGDDDDDGEELTSTEPATNQGQAAQAMRHTEALMKMFLMSNQAVLTSLVAQNENLSKRANQGDEKFLQALDLFADLTLRASQDLNETRRLEANSKRKDLVLEKLAVLAGPVVTKMLGSGPGAGEAALASIGGLVESFSTDQMNALMQILKPEQMTAFGLLIEAYQKQNPEKKGTEENATP